MKQVNEDVATGITHFRLRLISIVTSDLPNEKKCSALQTIKTIKITLKHDYNTFFMFFSGIRKVLA